MGQWLPAVNQHQVIFSFLLVFFTLFLSLSSFSQRHCLGSLSLSTLSKHIILSSLFLFYFFPPFSRLCWTVFFSGFSSLLDSVFFPLFRAYKILLSLFFLCFFPLFSSLLDSQSPATLLSVSSYFPFSRTHYFTQFLELKP